MEKDDNDDGSVEEENNNNNSNKDDDNLDWIKSAMGSSSSNTEEGEEPPELFVSPSISENASGLVGFAVDSTCGFVGVLQFRDSSSSSSFAYVVVNAEDRQFLGSAEALCLVQLAGGMDLGAAVFSPDTLVRLVHEQMSSSSSSSPGDDKEDARVVDDLRKQISLLAIRVVIPPGTTTATTNTNTMEEKEESPNDDPARASAIADGAPRVLPAVRRLPGLSRVTEEDVVAAMRRHADSNGGLDRTAFMDLLDTLRRGTPTTGGGVGPTLTLTVSVQSNDGSGGLTLVDVPGVTPFEGLALSLRYGIVVTVTKEEESVGDDSLWILNDTKALLTRFPRFRPLRELEEDAKVMDGFIPSMFFKENDAPTNEDKAI